MLYEQNLWHSQWEKSFFDTNQVEMMVEKLATTMASLS